MTDLQLYLLKSFLVGRNVVVWSGVPSIQDLQERTFLQFGGFVAMIREVHQVTSPKYNSGCFTS